MICVKNISYSYPADKNNRKEVLADVTFDMENGEFVSILGSSGCGKTTLVNILAGYLKNDTGKIIVNNVEVNKPGRNRIVVNQENDLFDWMTVEENMKLVNSDQKDIDKYLNLVGLREFKEYLPKKLSGGMKKRLSLARALVVNPDFLILDEPFAFLDHVTREDLHTELDKIFSFTKKTILLVTHNIDEAIFLSDRIIVLGDKPASVVNDVKISFPHPRRAGIKNTKSFSSLKSIIKKSYLKINNLHT